MAHPQALDLSDCGNSLANGDQQSIGAVTDKAAHSCHVWRDRAEDVYITAFSWILPGVSECCSAAIQTIPKGFQEFSRGLI